LEGLALQLPVGQLTIRPEDHRALFDSIAGTVSPKLEQTQLRRPFRGLDSVKRMPHGSDRTNGMYDEIGYWGRPGLFGEDKHNITFPCHLFHMVDEMM